MFASVRELSTAVSMLKDTVNKQTNKQTNTVNKTETYQASRTLVQWMLNSWLFTKPRPGLPRPNPNSDMLKDLNQGPLKKKSLMSRTVAQFIFNFPLHGPTFDRKTTTGSLVTCALTRVLFYQ